MNDLKNNKFLVTVTPIILYIYLVINGILGVKFGRHWDEWVFMNSASDSLKNGDFLPHLYYYPSFCYYVVLSAAGVYKTFFGINDVELLFSNQSFYHFIRSIFVIISSLIVFWVYLLSLKITKNYWAALIAGLIICASFEFSYHSRWAVSDCIVAQFVTLSTLVLFLDINIRNKIIFSSLIAGIAAGTKYTGGIVCLIIVFFILSSVKLNRKDLKTAAGYLLLLLGFSFIGFIITTSGALFEFDKFIQDVIVAKNAYSSGQYGHTIKPRMFHFLKIIEYIIFSLFSKNPEISIFIFLLAMTGVYSAFIREKWILSGLFITLFIYIIYLSTFKLMIVRNILYVLPFFAVFASIGFDYISKNIRIYKVSYAFKLIVLLILFYSCSYVITATLTVKNRNSIILSQELENYMSENKDKEFIFSLKVSSRLNLVTDSTVKNKSDNTYLVFYKDEVPFQFYTANIRDQFTEVIGIDDVNFNYYPTWCGKNRIIIMKYSKASEDILYFTIKRGYPDFRFLADNIHE